MLVYTKLAVLAIGLTKATAQFSDIFKPIGNPEIFWEAQINPVDSPTGTRSPEVLYGNGVYLTPDQTMLITTSVGGTVSAFGAMNGELMWEYIPKTEGSAVSCKSGITFANVDVDPYIVFSIIENENTVEPYTRVIALTLDGQELWKSSQLEGVGSGTPVSSASGEQVFLTHNSNFGSTGHFTVLLASMGGQTLFSQQNTTNPFSPVGVYHNPAEGYYDGGEGNTNDIVLWSFQPKPGDSSVGVGATFAFQLPIAYPDKNPTSYILLGAEPRNFQSIVKPVITNEGRSAYFGTSRSGYSCWVGVANLKRFYFSRPTTGSAGFTRGILDENLGLYPSQGVYAPPGLSSDPAEPIVFGGTASTEFVRMSHDLTQTNVVATDSIVKTQPIVEPDDSFVYFIEENGVVHRADFDNLSDIWTYQLPAAVLGQFALRENGSILYAADVNGFVTALQVTEIPETPSPSPAPTETASDSPSRAPAVPTDPPTPAPSIKSATGPSVGPGVPTIPNPLQPTDPPSASTCRKMMSTLVVAAFTVLGCVLG